MGAHEFNFTAIITTDKKFFVLFVVYVFYLLS